MSNDIRTALDIIQDENEILINAFVEMRNKELLHQPVNSCTMEKPCIKCSCLWCGVEIPILIENDLLHKKLHNDCYYKILKEWIP